MKCTKLTYSRTLNYLNEPNESPSADNVVEILSWADWSTRRVTNPIDCMKHIDHLTTPIDCLITRQPHMAMYPHKTASWTTFQRCGTCMMNDLMHSISAQMPKCLKWIQTVLRNNWLKRSDILNKCRVFMQSMATDSRVETYILFMVVHLLICWLADLLRFSSGTINAKTVSSSGILDSSVYNCV